MDTLLHRLRMVVLKKHQWLSQANNALQPVIAQAAQNTVQLNDQNHQPV